MFRETVAAINRTLIAGLERYFGFFSALGANYGKHFAMFSAVTIAAAFIATVATANGFVLETFFHVKFLLARAEDKILAAVFALECLVFKSHSKNLLISKKSYLSRSIMT